MSKKKPRSKDPHSWIKDTTKKSVEAGAAEAAEATEEAEAAEATEADETTAEPEEEAADESGPRRFVTIEYDTKDGSILATHEVPDEDGGVVVQAPRDLAEGKAEASIALTGELFDKTLLDLHENYKVVVSKSKPTLVPKG